MLIDILFIIMMVIAIVKGYSRGFIIAVFSLLALIIGLAAAVKLSVVTAAWLKDVVNLAAMWLPVLAFAIVFLVVVLLVRLGALALEKTAQLALLGWINRLAGILLYMALYVVIFSVILFYAEKINLVRAESIASSRTYDFVQPWGPKAMNALGALVPVFKDMFHQLEEFFTGISDKLQRG